MKATIKATKLNDAGYWNFSDTEGQWYGCGKKSPGEKGDVIEFEVEENGKYKNAKNVRKVAQVQDAPKASAATAGTDWAKKDAMISFQAARNAANALLSIAVQAGFSDAPDTYSKLKAESDKLTKSFFEQTSNLGGAGGSKPAYKPDPDDPLNSDQIPFG